MSDGIDPASGDYRMFQPPDNVEQEQGGEEQSTQRNRNNRRQPVQVPPRSGFRIHHRRPFFSGIETGPSPIPSPGLSPIDANVRHFHLNVGPLMNVSQQTNNPSEPNPSPNLLGPPQPHQHLVHQHRNGPVQVRMVQVQVEPLTPQPVPPSSLNTTNEQEEDSPGFERFKCEICYEYLNKPVGCGRCSSRFCRACLQRVYESDQQRQHSPRCPVCRCEYDQMAPDEGIYGVTNNSCLPTLPCQYASVGCPERKIPLPEIANHEAVCEHVQMRCRYAQYGCAWTGKRGLIASHEEFGCKVAPTGPFIEQFRQMKADHNMRWEMITQQIAANSRFVHMLRSTYARDNQRKSLTDVFRLAQYCYTLTCLTPHFFMTKDLWVSYWRNNESRAVVINFCSYIPFMAACFGVTRHAIISFFDFFDVISSEKASATLAKVLEGKLLSNMPNATTATDMMVDIFQNSQAEELLVNIFLGFCVGTLGFLVVILTFIDVKSNILWDKISIPRLGSFTLVGDVLAISIFTLLLAIMEYHEASFRADFVWMTVLVTSTFFPAFIISISHFTARLVTGTPDPPSFNMMDMGRAVEPCMFGLRCSMLITWFGVVPALDASIAICLIPRTSRIYLKNSFYDHMPRIVCFGLLGIKIAYWAFQIQSLLYGGQLEMEKLMSNSITPKNARTFFSSSPDAVSLSAIFDSIALSFMATTALMITNYIIITLFSIGIAVGKSVAQTSQVELNPENIARGTIKEYSSLGLLVFGSWVISIALLAYI